MKISIGTRPDWIVLCVTIDRTNWYWGKQKINIFMLGVAYEGIAIPLFWTCLPKAGCSNVKEQKELINRFIKTLGTSQILGLLGDREFGSGGLSNWLNKKKIPFYIRIKEWPRLNHWSYSLVGFLRWILISSLTKSYLFLIMMICVNLKRRKKIY